MKLTPKSNNDWRRIQSQRFRGKNQMLNEAVPSNMVNKKAKGDSVGGILSMHHSLISFQISIESKLDILNQSIINLTREISKQGLNNRVDWAIANAGTNSFKFYVKNRNKPVDSTEFVRKVLMSFRRGTGRFIGDFSMIRYDGFHTPLEIEEGECQFRTELSNQIQDLICKMPRIAREDKGYAIYYS